MAKTAGLRTEIIVHLVLLMGAALLFSGVLLLRLTERELVDQQVSGDVGVTALVARSLTRGTVGGALPRAAPMFAALPAATAPSGWAVAGSDLRLLEKVAGSGSKDFPSADLGRVRFASAPLVQVRYRSSWLPFGPPGGGTVLVTASIRRGREFAGALQAVYPLASVGRRIRTGEHLVLVYAFLYGGVLVLFGGYLLGRTVVKPVLRLRAFTAKVAAGHLEERLEVEGPAEIAGLVADFNAMTEALQESRALSEAQIASLEDANARLQQTREELIRSEKMASVGHLAAGMAHEIGNPLGAMVGYLELLRGELPAGKARELAERAAAESGRIDHLVRDLLDYAAPNTEEATPLDAAGVLVEARDLVAQQGGFGEIEVVDELPSTLPETIISRHKLLQVCVNLLLNARDACGSGGRITLAGGGQISGVWLAVSDDGAGMSEQTAHHIFDPFFTTKDPGKGRGLGLAVCQRIVAEAGGRIEVRSAPGAGSTFTIHLPRVQEVS